MILADFCTANTTTNTNSTMKKNLLFIFIIASYIAHAQTSTYQQVYNIFQGKCTGCHNLSVNSGQLNLQASASTVYTKLVNFTPVNPAAASRGDKRVSPGDPHRSFLLRKINNNLDTDNGISQPSEGAVMPNPPNAPLSKYEIELVQQWILAGAPQTGVVVDTATINEYYTVGGIDQTSTLAPPAPGTGFQIHVGKVFIPKNTETEYFLKYPTKVAATEVTQLELAQPPQSHHFVIYKFFTGQDVNFSPGLRYNSGTGANGPSHGSADALCAFAPMQVTHTLPPTTAYYLEQNAVFDLNLHIVNTSPDSVLAAEIYFNMYTQPVGTAQKYMYRRNFPDLGIVIPPGDTTSFTQLAQDSSETNMWEIWILYTHTHRFGIDYDVWERNADGSQGTQVYEGWMDWTYTFNQGYYGWGIHAPQEHFENPFLEVNPIQGLIHKATYYNYSTDTAYFGLTSQDEMMVCGFEYTYGPAIASVKNIEAQEIGFKAYPNPFTESAWFSYMLKEKSNVKVEVYDLYGQKIETIADEAQQSGNHTYRFTAPQPGIYFLTINVNGKVYTQKMVKAE